MLARRFVSIGDQHVDGCAAPNRLVRPLPTIKPGVQTLAPDRQEQGGWGAQFPD